MQQRNLRILATLKKNSPALLMLGYILFIFVAGMIWPSRIPLLQGLGRIIRAPGVLITDYMAVAGPGPTLVNASLVGLIGLAMVYFSGAAVSGPTVAAIFTMMGFALFGKSIFNILPIIAGVMLMSFYKRERFRQFVILAMFGTTLAPLVSHICFSLHLAPVWGILIGIVAGALLPELATHFLAVHAGFNLYNIGFAAGFFGTLITSQLRAFGRVTDMTLIWSVDYTAPLTILLLFHFTSQIIIGTILEPRAWRKLIQIFRQPGLLVSDFVLNTGLAPTLINMGLVGLIGLGYVKIADAPINGPVMGALLTMTGFAAFGKHPLNIIPVMAGVFFGTKIKIWNASDPGAILAGLFCTALAPVAGTFGPVFGFIAGYLHLGLVMQICELHGGISLYNNGFAAGIIAAVMITLARVFNVPAGSWTRRLEGFTSARRFRDY